MTGKLTVTPEKLISTSSQFSSANSKVSRLTQQMMHIANDLRSTWGGDAANTFYRQLNALQDDTSRINKKIGEHAEDLRTMAQEYQKAEQAAQQRASALPTDPVP